MKKYLYLICIMLVSLSMTSEIVAQPCTGGTILFQEDFDEAVGATSGTDNSGNNVAWTATCPGCVAGDNFEVDDFGGSGCSAATGGLRGQDTNGPATFTASGIDVSSCAVVYFSFDYCSDGYTGSGNLECVAECNGCSGIPSEGVSNGGCNNCWDYLYGELDWGSGSSQQIVLGDDCNAPASGSTGSAICGSTAPDGNPIPPADLTSVDINVVMAMWAGGEDMIIEDVTLICYTAAEVDACSDPEVTEVCPVPPPCDITNLSAAQVCTNPGAGDNSYTLDVSFGVMNGSAGGMFEVYVDPAATNNPTTLIGTYTPVAGVIAVPVADYPGDATDLEQGLQICVVDAGRPDCSDCTTINEFLCVACDITAATATPSACDNNGTSPLDTDDTFTFTLDVTQMDASLLTYTFDGAALGLGTAEAGTYGAAGYTSAPVTIGALAGTTVTLTIVDDVDPTCTFEVMLMVPETCSACEIMASAFPTCPAVGGTYDISYTIMNGVGPFTINGTAGLAATGTVTGFAYVDQNTKETLTIEDEGNPGCMIMYDVLQLNCAAQDVCDCSNCDSGGAYTINAQGAGNGNGFSMFYALVDGTGNVAVVNTTGTFMVPDVDAMGNVITYEVYAINVLDAELAGAQASVTVGAPFDAVALAGNFCADASCNAMFMEDCACLPDPLLTCPTTVNLCGDAVPLNLSDGNANTAGTSIVIYGGTCAAFIDNLGTTDITDDVLDPSLASALGTYNLTVQLQSADGCLSPEVECIILFTTNCDAEGGKFDEE